MTTYQYAIVPAPGMYGSQSKVRPVARSNSLERAQSRAAKATREFRAAMRKHGGSSGGYRVIEHNGDDWWFGYELDRMPTAE